ncbi:MAG: ATP-binding cassette domain-containing protein [Acidobacteriota bacterium]|nr:ATP-binding cassette domain-containing protein [Acidobacteriota bacterium]
MDGRTPRSLRWLGALLVVYLGYPLVAFVVRVATGSNEGWHAPGLWSAIGVSVASASASLLIGVLTGIPLAYVLARRRGWLSGAIGVLVQLPLAVPPLVTGIILIYIVGPYTFLGRLSGQRLTETIWGLIIAQSFVSIPFLVVVARSAFRAVDPALGEVAATLGHGPLARFLRVDVPAAADGIRTGMILSWLRAFGEYGTVVILAYHPYSLPVYVDNLFSSAPLSQAEAPTALAFAVAAIAIALSTIHRLPHRRRTVLPDAIAPPRMPPTTVSFDIDAHAGDFRLQVAHGRGGHRLAIVGPSGSGKSLTLRALVGLLGPAVGGVAYGDLDVTDTPTERRRVGFVPQGFGLMPGRTVWEQVMFGVDADPARAAWWLRALHLDHLVGRLPEQLSGGQRQRVSLARALSPGPSLVLLDEPFSALDAPVRDELRRELRALQRDAGLSTVLVTHDPAEAAMLADEVLVLCDGRVLQAGTVAEVYRQPASVQVARLLGVRNIGHGVIGPDGILLAGSASVAAGGAGRLAPGTEVLWTVSPELVEVRRPDGAPSNRDLRSCRALVRDVIDLGTTIEITVRLEGGPELTALTADAPAAHVGDECLVCLDPEAVHVWPSPPDADHSTTNSPRSRPPR